MKLLTIAFRQIAKKLWIIALIAIDCAILAYILASALIPAVYGAEAQVLITGGEEILDSYTRVATSRAVCNRLITDFSLASDADQIAANVRIEQIGDSSCLSVRILCHDPQTSVILTDALVRYTAEAITQVYGDTVAFTYNEPVTPTEPYGISPLNLALIAFLAALLLSVAGFCVPILGGRYFIDRKSTEDLLGIPVLGIIPGEKDQNGGNRT